MFCGFSAHINKAKSSRQKSSNLKINGLMHLLFLGWNHTFWGYEQCCWFWAVLVNTGWCSNIFLWHQICKISSWADLNDLLYSVKFSILSFRYWKRPLNPRKLMEVGHLGQKRNMSLQRTVKVHRLPEVRVGCHLQTKWCYYRLTFARHIRAF